LIVKLLFLINLSYIIFPIIIIKEMILTELLIIVLITIKSISSSSTSSSKQFISIRGDNGIQALPFNMAKSFNTFTFNENTLSLEKVENDLSDEKGWCNPTSFNELYLPKDLPIPQAVPSLGIAVIQGIPRYIMPSIILSLETPERIWRNRGLNSLPRANSWIDLFSPYINLDRLSLSSFSKVTGDVRFLEDQDGSSSWIDLSSSSSSSSSKGSKLSSPLMRPETEQIKVAKTLRNFKEILKEGNNELKILNEGYNFVDIPLSTVEWNLSSSQRIKQYLSDFEDPKRLLEIENPDELYSEELIGELDIKIEIVAPGRTSKYLPEVYKALYEEGNIILN